MIITPSTTIYLGKVGTSAYCHTALAFSPRAVGKVTVNPEMVFTLPVTESDYDAVHRLIDSTNGGSRRFSLCVGVCHGSEIVLHHFDEVHIVFPFPSPDKDYIQVYVC